MKPSSATASPSRTSSATASCSGAISAIVCSSAICGHFQQDSIGSRRAMQTQVGIVGGGPAGLTLALLLAPGGHRLRRARGARSRVRRAACARRPARAEHGRPAARRRASASGWRARGSTHTGVYLHFDDRVFHVDMLRLTGRKITIYGQQEVVKDEIAALLDRGVPVHFEARRRVHASTPSADRSPGRGEPSRVRLHRRLRRLPRRLPRRDPPSRADRARLRLSVQLARDPRRGGAEHRRADLRRARPRLRAALDALAEGQPAVPPGAQRRRSRTGPTSGSGTS